MPGGVPCFVVRPTRIVRRNRYRNRTVVRATRIARRNRHRNRKIIVREQGRASRATASVKNIRNMLEPRKRITKIWACIVSRLRRHMFSWTGSAFVYRKHFHEHDLYFISWNVIKSEVCTCLYIAKYDEKCSRYVPIYISKCDEKCSRYVSI